MPATHPAPPTSPTFPAEPASTPPGIAPPTLAPLALAPAEIATARRHVDASRAASTRKAYDADWRRFSAWCGARGATPLPAGPALVAVYLSALADRGQAPPSIARALAAIAHAHHRAGRVAPHRADGGAVVADALAGIRRSRVDEPDRKHAADADVVMLLLRSIEGNGLVALRDRALIAFGMALAARRSELVALNVADLAWETRGLRAKIRRSKTDQEAEGAMVAVPEGRLLTPLAHLRAWLDAAGITEGAVFRPLWKGNRVRDARLSDHAVARVIQARARAAGLDPDKFAGHSLRAGFITAAARAGADAWKIQQVSRHKSIQALSGYVRDARLFDNHAGEPFL
jgi:site-specific recombinase XerD